MRSDNPWHIKSSRIVYQNPWIRIHEDTVIMPSGKPGVYAYLESKDSVVITALNDKKELCLIRQFSYPTAKWSWRAPQGGGEGEDLMQAAKRELQEETGVTADTWHHLGNFRVCNGLMTETCGAYLASGISITNQKDLDEGIDGMRWVSMEEADKMIQRGDIDDSQSIVAIHLAQKHLADKVVKQ